MNTPNKITISRIVATVVMIVSLFVLSFFKDLEVPYLFAAGNFKGINLVFFVVFIFFLLASFTDMLDGKIARKTNQITNLGKFLDPVADKLLINSMMIFLLSKEFSPYNQNQTSYTCVWCVIILVVRDIVVDSMRFMAASKGKVVAANIFGKIKTVFEMITISLILLNDFPFGYLFNDVPKGLLVSDFFEYITTFFSVLSGVIYLIQNKQVFKEEK